MTLKITIEKSQGRHIETYRNSERRKILTFRNPNAVCCQNAIKSLG